MITQSQLKEILRYDPMVGVFSYLRSPTNSISVGQSAGAVTKKGYVRIRIKKHNYHKNHGYVSPHTPLAILRSD